MESSAAFHLWPRLHAEILGFLDRAPEGGLAARLPGAEMDLAGLFRHVAAVEDYWRSTVEEPGAAYREIPSTECPDAASLRRRLTEVFAATEEMLRGSTLEQLAARPVATRFPVKNALEALTLCHLHTVHHRSEIVSTLRALGADPGDWI